MNTELAKLIQGLRVAKDIAESEPKAEMLCFLIEQALDEAAAEAKRRGQPVPIEHTAAPQ